MTVDVAVGATVGSAVDVGALVEVAVGATVGTAVGELVGVAMDEEVGVTVGPESCTTTLAVVGAAPPLHATATNDATPSKIAAARRKDNRSLLEDRLGL